jgi:DNA replication protein DnaC
VYFIYYPNLLDLAKKTYSSPDGPEQWRIDEIFGRGLDPVQVLVIDDLGKEHRTSSGWAENYFDHLVRSRFLMGLSTIVTTNVAIKDWGQVYGESMASFAHEALTPLVIRSDKGDRRLL